MANQYSYEAEEAVLGAILVNPIRYDEVRELVCADDFAKPGHKMLFQTIGRLIESGQRADAMLVINELGERVAEVGGIPYVVDLVKNVPSDKNATSYAAYVADRALTRRLAELGQTITTLAYSNHLTTTDKLDTAEQQFSTLRPQEENGPAMVGEILRDFISVLEDRFENHGKVSGVLTGFERLDNRFNGLKPGDLVIIAGRPAMGKTTLGMNIAEHVAITQHHSAMVFSLEMPKEQLIERMIASVSGVPYQAVKTGEVMGMPDYAVMLQSGAIKIRDASIIIDDRAAPTVFEIKARSRAMHRRRPLSLVLIDYLQLIKAGGPSREQAVAEISRELKALAKELRCPVIALSQLNRACEARTDKRPMMSDLRESGAIEQDADIIMFCYRDEVYNEHSNERGIAEIITRKHRAGETGTDRLQASLDRCRFNNLDPCYAIPQALAKANRRTRSIYGDEEDE